MNALAHKLWLRRYREGDASALSAIMAADAHEMAAPTHVGLKRGEIVAYASLAQIPLVLPWFHTQKCHAADSMYFVNQAENFLAELMPETSPGWICVPFACESPFEPLIEKFGYVSGGKFNLAFKKVK